MSILNVTMKYTLEITTEEFRVISAALRSGGNGQTLREEFREKALAIQNRLFHARNQQVKTQLERIRVMEESEDEQEDRMIRKALARHQSDITDRRK